MAIVAMEKIRLYVHKDAVTEALNAVQRLGIVEFNEVAEREGFEKAEKTVFEFNYVSSRLDFAVEFLSKYEQPATGWKKIKNALEGNKIFVSEKKIEELMQTFYFNEVIEKVEDLEEALNDVEGKIKDLKEEYALLSPWESVDVKLAALPETKSTKIYTLHAHSGEELAALANNLKGLDLLFHKETVSETRALLVFFKEDEEKIKKELVQSEIEIVGLPRRRGTPKEELERIERALKKAEKNRAALIKEAEKLVKYLPKLKIISDRILWKKEKHNLISAALKRSEVLAFEGWCPKDRIAALSEAIETKTPLFAIETIEPDEGERPPVEIKNNKIVTPFETITRLYGLPGEKDLDPTPFLAGFFFIFFGLSLTDVGYGIFLALTTALALTFFKIPKGVRPMIVLLMLGGISSAIIGALFGGYFGIDMKHLPEWAQALQKFDPIANPLPVFYLALTFGVIQIMFGLVLKIMRDAKNGAVVDGILDNGPWLALFAAIIAFVLNKAGVVTIPGQALTASTYTALAALVLTQGRKERGVFKKLTKGVFSLYDSINFFSDILSYSRLLALGLATSALAFAVNLIAQIVGDMIPYVGTILMVAVLIVGHLFNLAVNVLGAFIHSARLQFVEFFGKFITDSGRVFTPFKRKERYVIVK